MGDIQPYMPARAPDPPTDLGFPHLPLHPALDTLAHMTDGNASSGGWMHTAWGAVAFALACELAGVIGAATTETGGSSWYEALDKPSFQPPGWVFGPVWTLLYALMGLAAWRIWRLGPRAPGVRRALALFGVQLLLNAIWSPVFFGARAIGLALGILIAMWITLSATMLGFYRLDRSAAALLLPYHLWVTFAAVLNATIVALN